MNGKFGIELDKSLIISQPIVIVAGIAALICTVSYFWMPKKLVFPVSLATYFVLNATIAFLILNSGEIASPFTALWLLSSMISGMYGLYGLIPMLVIAGAFAVFEFVQLKLDNQGLAIIAFNGILPIIMSAIIWHGRIINEGDKNTAFKHLENELSAVANKSDVVINAIGDGVIAIDNKGLIQLINPAAQNMIGWDQQNAAALDYRSVLKLVDRKGDVLPEGQDPLQQVLNINQQVRTNELSLVTSSDKKIMISLLVSPAGEMGAGAIAVFRDITKEKAEEREQAEFISTASHEMRTPVAAIEGYLSLTLNPQTAQIDERAKSYIQKAHESTQHLGHLFQDLLDTSKAEDGRLSNNPKITNVAEFICDVAGGLEQKAAQKGLKLTYKHLSNDEKTRRITPAYYINVDKNHLREILNNLIENAIKYTVSGEVFLDVTGDDDKVVISVKDSGIGIPAEDMTHLFQKFYRIDTSDTREIGGTGLGLYLCRRLAEVIGGHIWAESVLHGGSTFFLEVPRVNSTEANKLIAEENEQKAQEEQRAALNKQAAQMQTATVQPAARPAPAAPVSSGTVPRPAANVPRTRVLTPEQIAAYVAKQTALASQQKIARASSDPTMTVPVAQNQPIVANKGQVPKI